MKERAIQKLTEFFSKFPTVGSRTALRFSYYILKLSNQELKELISTIIEARKNVKFCSFCFKSFEGTSSLCEICSSVKMKNILCIIEKESDLIAINQTKKYPGLFFILGGTLSPLKKESLKKIRIKELMARIKEPQKYGFNSFQEIIIATNFTAEGENTALYLERILKEFKIKITRLARGLSKGGELEYVDEETISSALKNRN